MAGVFAAELRGALIAYAEGGIGGLEGFGQHEAAGFLQADDLLVLERAHGGDALEVLVESRGAHIYGLSKLFNDKGLIVLLSDHLDGLSNPVRMAADDGEN